MTRPPAHSEPARYREVSAKSVTRLRGTVDPWFLGRYGMNLYRGCEHGCRYCDGRAERYYVDGDFDRDIVVKHNAVDVLRKELGRAKEPGFVLVGGGVCDAYQPAEAKYRLARGALELALEFGFPVHVLTKSSLVERDLDLLAQINRRARAILSFSIQTTNDDVRARFEPGAAAIAERLRLMREARRLGLGVGAMAMPVLPGISDQPDSIDRLVETAVAAGADFVCTGGLTLRPGAQKDAYFALLRDQYPELVDGYLRVYRSNRPSGIPDPRYLDRLERRFRAALLRHGIPSRPPHPLFRGLMPCYAEVGVRLEHQAVELCSQGRPGLSLGRAGFAIQAWARDRISTLGRRKGFHHSHVEAEFRERLQDGSIAELLGLQRSALQAARELCPRAGASE